MSSPLKPDQIAPAIGEYVAPARWPAHAGRVRSSAGDPARLRPCHLPPGCNRHRKKKEEARLAVAPVFRTFATGQVIVTEGQAIAAQDIEALNATGVIDDGIDFYAVAAGAIIAVGFGLLLGALHVPLPAVRDLRRIAAWWWSTVVIRRGPRRQPASCSRS